MANIIMAIKDTAGLIALHISELKPDIKVTSNPIALLRLLSRRNWMFFFVSPSAVQTLPSS
jgi:hypothetical protein